MPEQHAPRREETESDQQKKLQTEKETFMKTIDPAVLAGYNAGMERHRLRTGIGIIEFERTKEILLEKLPKPPAVIYDVGGAYGEYSWWLASLGYEVHLFDLSETNINMSAELAAEYPGVTLAAAEVCDARSVPRPDGSADAVLLMGPLYSITEYEERIFAIRECRRLLKEDGILFSAALTPYSVLIPRIALYHLDDTKKRRELDDPAVISMIERALEELCEEEADEAAVRLAQKLLRRHNGEDARKEMQKVLAAMARRGYSYEDSREAIEAAIRLEEEEN